MAGLGHIFPPDRYPYPSEEVVARWRGFEGVVVVAERAGHPVGVAATADCWLHGLYVVPDEWGRGAAGLLHDDAVVRMQADGCVRARLWCLEENVRARRFYERRGWHLVDEKRVVPYPPHPIDVSYALDVETRRPG